MSASSECHDHLLTIFAHELREPLASILLAAHALSEIAPDDAGQQGTSQSLGHTIARQGNYMAHLIDGALQAYARGSTRACLRKERCDINHVVLDAAETVTPVMRDRRQQLIVSLAPQPVFMLADPLRVQQVLINLLGNAAKYTESGGSVWLSVTGGTDHVAIEVRDSGIGIAPTILPRVFDLFEQGARSPVAGYDGFGIGLAVVKTLVEEHGGTVRARSEGTNRGATFVVRLPIDDVALSNQSTVRVAPRRNYTVAADPTFGAT